MNNRDNAIAIVGMSCRFPDADQPNELWQNLCSGKESVRVFTEAELVEAGVPLQQIRDPGYVPVGTVVRDFDAFDAAFFGYTPREAEILDPQQRLLLECAYHALEDAGYAHREPPFDVGVYVGVSSSSYAQQNLATRPDVIDAMGVMALTIANDKDFAASQIAYRLGLTGPAVSIATACSTSLVAVHNACTALLNYECDMALAGGASIKAQPIEGYVYQHGGIMSADGHCRPFSADATGTIGGCGAGMVSLKRLADAEADGDPIYAVIIGSAINNDGNDKLGFTAPSVRGQARAIREALAVANTDPAAIGYVEAHGTATPLGDPVEIAALTEAHDNDRSLPPCAIGSIKSNFGHLDAAAGVAGLIKAALAVSHGSIPPSLHYHDPNPQIGMAQTRFFVADRLQPWPQPGPRTAGVSSFGIGGTNAHVVLHEAPLRTGSGNTARQAQLMVTSAKDPSAITTSIASLNEHLAALTGKNLADASFTLIKGRPAYRHRGAKVCSETAPGNDQWLQQEATTDLQVAWLFPGQGSQHVDMGRELFEQEPVFRDTVELCAKWIRQHAGWDPIALLYPDHDADRARAQDLIGNTRYTQVALFIVEYALAQLWLNLGKAPDLMLGHSLGEYTAACVAGVLDVEDALKLVDGRSRLMASLPKGTMASVRASAETLLPMLPAGVSLCADNGPEHCVIGGDPASMMAVLERLNAASIESHILEVSHAFHSAMLDPILDSFRALVASTNRRAPRRQYVSATTGQLVTEAETLDPDYWVRHLRETVGFRTAMASLRALPDSWRFLDMGPAGTAATLARVNGIPMNRVIRSLPRAQDAGDARAAWLQAVGELWTAGCDLDLRALHAGEQRQTLRLPGYAFLRTRHWLEPGAPADFLQRHHNGSSDPIFVSTWKRDQAALAASPIAQHRLVFAPSIATVAEWLGQDAANAATVVLMGDVFAQRDRDYSLRATHPEDYDRLFADLAQRGIVIDQIVFGWPLANSQSFDRASHLLNLQAALANLVAGRKKHAVGVPTAFTMLVRRAFQIAGEDVLNPDQRALAAMVTVLGQEEPDWSCRVIDLGDHVDPINLQLNIQSAPSPERRLLACRGRSRWQPAFERVALPLHNSAINWDQQVIVITGGAGAIGLALAQHFAERGARVVICGRRAIAALPTNTQQTLSQLAHGNQRVTYAPVDLENVDALTNLLTHVRSQEGRIDLLIHAAAAMSKSGLTLLSTADQASFGHQYPAKINGTLALASAASNAGVKNVVLMSSLAATLGGIGMAAYAAANAFMEALVDQPSPAHREGRWLAIGWDGLSADHAAPAAFSAEDVADLMQRLIQADASGVYLASRDDMNDRWQQWGNRQKIKTRATIQAAPNRPGYIAPATDTERSIADAFEELIGVSPVGANDDFFALGGDSLLATQLCSRLRKQHQVDLPISAIFEHPKVEHLAAHLIGLQASTILDDSEMQDLMRDLADLDESALDALLRDQAQA